MSIKPLPNELLIDVGPALAAAVKAGCTCTAPLVCVYLEANPPDIRVMHRVGLRCPAASIPAPSRRTNSRTRRPAQ